MNKNIITRIVIALLAAFLGTQGICYITRISSDYVMAASALTIPVFAGLFIIWRKIIEYIDEYKGRERKKVLVYSGLLTYIFSVLYICGWQLQKNKMTDCGVAGKAMIAYNAILLSMAFFIPVFLMFRFVDRYEMKQKAGKFEARHYFIFSSLIIFISFIPAFLAYYPIVLSYDFHAQVLMAERGFQWFSLHHPQIHTLQIWLFYTLGKNIGNVQAGMAFMALFHMVVTSLCMGYSVKSIYKVSRNRNISIAAMLAFALYAPNAVMTVNTTKDVMFAALFLLFVSLTVERIYLCDVQKEKIIKDIFIVLVGILMCMYRNNARYALAVAGVALMLCAPLKQKLVVLIVSFTLFVGYKCSSIGLYKALGSNAVLEDVEKYSAIIQAFGRVAYYHMDELDSETYTIIAKYVPEYCWNEYNPAISDPLKNNIAPIYCYSWAPSIKQVIKDWIKIGFKYPNEYIDSFLETTRGYWFIDDTSYCKVLGDGLEGRMGMIYTYNSSYHPGEVEEIKHESKFPFAENLYEQLISADVFLEWPIITVIFRVAFYCLALSVIAMMAIYKKKKRLLAAIVFPIIYLFTCYLGPVVQFRYAYPIMICVPLFTVLLLVEVGHKEECKQIS